MSPQTGQEGVAPCMTYLAGNRRRHIGTPKTQGPVKRPETLAQAPDDDSRRPQCREGCSRQGCIDAMTRHVTLLAQLVLRLLEGAVAALCRVTDRVSEPGCPDQNWDRKP